ncbi:MAG: twin-arginine translocase TatA/TatE family subunit [Flavobacteriales bacterium]|jgi:sec-independent protein translocase protein TatA|nr:twin-arginine translocase TatA/TatE family subunit [Flavobacteriales bacterium]MDG1439519.1 twin-arginine translocase TatA/TatE family subunit [Flavobacteriales bacterium]MDG1797099.1 twin-arginine translocase TatA/TatE family subunit [Flavobacteriales bacterium]
MILNSQFLLLEGISAGELIFVFLVVLLFFGSKSIPNMARSLGRGMRQLRDASQQIQDDIKTAAFDDETEIFSNNKKNTKKK